MNTLLWWLVENTLTIAILIPIVAAASRLCRNRPALEHVLWVVVLLKFMTPPLAVWPIPLPIVSLVAQSRVAPVDGLPLASTGAHLASESDHAPLPMPEGPAISDSLRPAQPLADPATALSTALALLTGIWAVGFAACAARQARRITRHVALVRTAKKAPAGLILEIERIALQVGLRPPRALVTRSIASPFIWFLGRLSLIWPEAMCDRDDIIRSRGVIAHELAHARRGDHYLAWLELVAGLCWWWNPLFWFVRKRLRESAELACDAIALSVCPQSRRTYAELLLALSSSSSPAIPAPVLGIRAGSTTSFERRLSMILSERVSGKVPTWGLAAAAALAFLALPGWSLGQKPADPQPHYPPASIPAGDIDHDTRTTTARLEQVEAELKRLSRLLEGANQTTSTRAQNSFDAVRRDSLAPARDPGIRWKRLAVIDKKPASVSFQGTKHNFLVTVKDQSAYLSELEPDGRQAWHSKLPVELKSGEASDWVINEFDHQKVIVVDWAANGQGMRLKLDASTGKVMLAVRIDPLGPRDDKYAAHDPFKSVADRLRGLNERAAQTLQYERSVKLGLSDEVLTREIFKSLLSRDPTDTELEFAVKHFIDATRAGNRGSAIEDLFWVIINSQEFKSIKSQGPEKP